MYIYKITNLQNNKVYIGQTKTNYPIGRWSAHKNKLSNGTHRNPHLLSSWAKYGADVWKFEVIDKAYTIDELDELEISYIKTYKSIDPKFGYNVASGGSSRYTLSDEARRKIGDASRNRIRTEESNKKRRATLLKSDNPHHVKGVKKNIQHIANMSVGLKKKWAESNFREKMRTIRKHQMTDVLKKRISETKKIQYRLFGSKSAKLWPTFVSPSNETYKDIRDMTKFAKEHGLCAGSMRRVARGHRKSHKGWKLYEESCSI